MANEMRSGCVCSNIQRLLRSRLSHRIYCASARENWCLSQRPETEHGARRCGGRSTYRGFELDKARAERGTSAEKDAGAQFVNIRPRAFEVNAEGGFGGMAFDAVLANPPFEAIKAQNVTDRGSRTLSISRLDHRIVYDALNQVRADSGRSFLVLPGEMMGEGKLEERHASSTTISMRPSRLLALPCSMEGSIGNPALSSL